MPRVIDGNRKEGLLKRSYKSCTMCYLNVSFELRMEGQFKFAEVLRTQIILSLIITQM